MASSRPIYIFVASSCVLSRLLIYTYPVLSAVLDMILKPLMMPLLSHYLQHSSVRDNGHHKLHRITGFFHSGLFAAWIGDLLLLKGSQKVFFLGGLGSFAVMQWQYIQNYKKFSAPSGKCYLDGRPYLRIPAFLVGATFYACVYPVLPPVLRVGILIYTVLLTSMTYASLSLRGPKSERARVAAGSHLFMVSDLIIGVNKFVRPLGYAEVWICGTYVLGQYLIAEGLIGFVQCKKNTEGGDRSKKKK